MGKKYETLKSRARVVRRRILEVITSAKKGHVGGALSCADILVALYYGGILRVDPRNPRWGQRDRFLLSKGHAGVALYVILADLGFFDPALLATFGKNGSILGGHPDIHIPGIEANTGSLGHGLGIGAGWALAAKKDKTGYRVFVLLGDGECYEGSVWEAALFAGHHHLDNLTAIVDRNQLCVTNFTEDCNRLEPFVQKWEAFGWDAVEIDGHSFSEICPVLKKRKSGKNGKPLVIIANTVKGKGVSFMENQPAWHHGVPTVDEADRAKRELSGDELC